MNWFNQVNQSSYQHIWCQATLLIFEGPEVKLHAQGTYLLAVSVYV